MERYQPDQYGRMMPDAHGQWVSLRAAEITALDAAQKSSADAQTTVEALQRENAQLKALVRALPVYEADALITVDGDLDEIDRPALRSAVMELLEYRAALDATAPAECTNHFTDGSKIFPSRNCCSKGAK